MPYFTRIFIVLLLALSAGFIFNTSGHNQTTTYGPRVRVKEGLSTNWSGYAALTNLSNPANNSVSDVKGQWTIPNLTCTSLNTYSAVWVGIDGYSNGTVEQTGTEQDCRDGQPFYQAWFEMFPHWPVRIAMIVHAGDNMSAEVKYRGRNYFDIYLQNLTTSHNYHTIQFLKANRTSAEWIVEAPSSLSGVLPLANFGTANMSGSAATINGITGSINNSNWQNDNIVMVAADGTTVKSQPSALSTDGQSFSVNWLSN